MKSVVPGQPLSDLPVTSLEKIKKRLLAKKKTVFGLLVIILVSTVFAAGYLPQFPHFGKQYSGTNECISLAKKIEGKNMNGVYKLDCTLEPRAIANSSLTAQYLSYSGTPKDTNICLDPYFSIPPTAGAEYCVSWSGVVLSNGKMYAGLGDTQNGTPAMLAYDYCYSSTYTSYAPKATTHDLYFYKDDLYDRDVFNNANSSTPFGTCSVNGTTIYHYGKDVNVTYLTNVKVAYKNFPEDCYDVSLGRSFDQYQQCVDLVTAAHTTLNMCYSNIWPKPSKTKIITGYETQKLIYWGQSIWGDCETAYAQRMAALNRCGEITIQKLKDSCEPLVTHPSIYTTRVDAPI